MISTKCINDILIFTREKGYTIDEVVSAVSHIQYIQNQAIGIRLDFSEKLKEALRKGVKEDIKKNRVYKSPLVHKSISPIVSKVVFNG